MSTYVMADLHGCKTEFDAMLEQIHFTDYDSLWIIGDICDRGNDPIPLLMEIMRADNIHVIMGNHETMFRDHSQQMIDLKSNESMLERDFDLLTWVHGNGGMTTMEQFMELPTSVCYDIKTFLEDLPLYKNLTVKGKKYLLVHAGIPNDEAKTPLRKLSEDTLTWSHIAIDENPIEDKTLIVGHMPTFLYGKEYEGKIIHNEEHHLYHIDCGCVFGRKLGCLCLDDLKEYYIDSTYPYLSTD